MKKTILEIEGMACAMCESHMNDVVRKLYPDAKVKSSHKKKQTEIISEADLDIEKLKAAIKETGYTFKGYHSEPYVKKGFFASLFS